MKPFTAALLLVALTVPALAGPKSEGAQRTPDQQYRHEVMESVGRHMGLIGSIVDDEVDRPNTDIVAHAVALHELALIHGDLYPAGSGPDAGKTRALPAVWSDASGFKTANDSFVAASFGMIYAAKTNDDQQISDAMRTLGSSCGTCHKAFRAERH